MPGLALLVRRLIAASTLLLVFVGGVPAADTATPENGRAQPALDRLTPEEARELVARLSDAEVRDLLLRQLDRVSAVAATPPTPRDTVAFVVDEVQTLRYRMGAMLAAAPDAPYAALFVIDVLTRDRDPGRLTELALGLALIFGCAALAEALFRRLLGRRIAEDRVQQASGTEFGKLGLLALRALESLLALTVFGATATIVYLPLHPEEAILRHAFWGLLLGIIGVRLTAIVARMALAPSRPDLRLPAIDDATARSLFRWTLGIASLVAFAAGSSPLLYHANLPEPLRLLLGTAWQWISFTVLIAFVWIRRAEIARLFAGPPRAPGQSARVASRLAQNWAALATFGLLALGLFATVARLLTDRPQAVPILQTLMLGLGLAAADGLLRIAVRRIVPPLPPGEPVAGEDAGAAVPDASSDYAPVIIRNLRVVLAVIALILLDHIWSIDLHAIAAGSVGHKVAESLLQIVLTLVLASAVWGIVKTAINRHAPHEEVDPSVLAEGEGTGTGLTRLQTLLPMLRKFVLVTLVVIVGMIIVSALGVDIGPLLAGAGVVGIAIGFGAQALVRDIVSGIFFLIDDAFRVGEYIDVGSAKGMVEKISIRSLRLRHHLGQINTIPFGEIKNVTNYSRDWVIMKLELRVPFDTDLEKVRKLVKRVGQELLEHPEHGPNFLQPLKSQGVHRMDDDAFIVRIKFMAKPGEQFVLRREVFRRVQEAFHQNGIRFAPRRVIVDSGGAPMDAAAAALAAERALAAGGPG